MDIREEIGLMIAELRQKQGLTQRQLEEISGVRQSHIARIEQGKYNIRIDILEKLAAALHARIVIKEEE